MGYFDSIIELNEVAIREFTLKAYESGDFEEFLNERSSFHNVRVNFPCIPQQFNSTIARSYLVLVSACFEEFLEELRVQCQSIKGIVWLWEEKESKLETAFKKISPTIKRDSDINYKICDYYRLIRNASVHDSEKQRKKLESEHKKLDALQAIKTSYSSLSAPNKFDSITFDDFILYTRAAKTVAVQLCESW